MWRTQLTAVAALLLPYPCYANEAITYSYDALGRLVQLSHTGTVNNGLARVYAHDATDNRTNVTVTGSPNSGSPMIAPRVPTDIKEPAK